MRLTLFWPIILALLLPAAAWAQTVQLPAGYAPGTAIGFGGTSSPWTAVDTTHPLPIGGKQENFALAAANTASSAATVYGGDYIFSQSCSAYGSGLALQVLGPDGATYQTVLSKNAVDAAGGTGVVLGSNAVVRVTLTATSGCNASLSRVP